ncbi:MAG: dipeptidase [Bacteroidales bacterium]|nr:dipeptidase [Bacteroidales bacterium]
MKQRVIRFLTVLSLLTAFSFTVKQDEAALRAKADRIHKSIISMDTHTDTAMQMYRGRAPEKLQVNLKKMREGHMDAVFFAAFVGQKARDDSSLQAAHDYTEAVIRNFQKYADEHSSEIGIARTAKEVRALKKQGKLIGILAIENGYALAKDISNVKKFYDLGVRYITLSHNNNNDICDAAVTEDYPKYGFKKGPEWHGLSPFGEEVVREMNRLGIIIDISHTSPETVADVLELSKAPVMASHSCCRDLCDHPRNLTDEQIKALAAKGGIIQIAPYHGFLSEKKEDANLQVYCDHVEHVKNLVGVDYVGYGSDFDGGSRIPGLEDESMAKNVTVELLRRGWTKKELKKFWGENVLRVMEQVEKVAAQSK